MSHQHGSVLYYGKDTGLTIRNLILALILIPFQYVWEVTLPISTSANEEGWRSHCATHCSVNPVHGDSWHDLSICPKGGGMVEEDKLV